MTASPDPTTFREERATLLAAFVRGITPQPPVSPAEWGKTNFIVPVGPMKGQRLDLSLTPYVVEPLDMLRVDAAATEVAIKKSAQTGFSTLGLVWLFCLIDTAPDDMMIVQPTISAARDFNEERLDPAIKATPAVRRRVRPQRSRSGEGSTTLSKKFPGGRLILTGANSATDLSAKTVRFALADEVDRWPADLEGQGDPMALLDARQISFSRTASHKKLVVSTPTNKGSSRVDKAYEAGDQRKWKMPCPHCGERIEFRFDQMRGELVAPFEAHYIAQCCGRRIDAWRQRDMVLAGAWEATRPGPGRQPSYHINALSSLLTSWDKVWEEYLKAAGDPIAEKAFVNLWLGESYEEQGADLDASKIAKAAESYPRNAVPPTVARTALVVDTQGDRLEWALWGFGPKPTTVAIEQWLLAAGVIEGDLETDAPWDELSALSQRKWPYSGGLAFPADAFGIDTGGNHTQAVYRFARANRKWRALKGSSQRDAVTLSTPRRIEVKNQFGRLLFKLPLYFVGTHDLKVWLSNALKAYENSADIVGGIHLTAEIADEAYCEQLTAEVLVAREKRDGRVVQEWHKVRARNEALDLAVYARALAFGPYPNGLGLDRLDGERWAALLAERHASSGRDGELFAPHVMASAKPQPAADQPAAADPAPAAAAALPPAPAKPKSGGLAAALARTIR